MIDSESVNKVLGAFAKFVSRLAGKRVEFTSVGSGERFPIAAAKVEKLFNDVTAALDEQKVNVIGSLEPGKIYCLSVDPTIVDLALVSNSLDMLQELGVQVIVLDERMSFVSIPEGYEVVEKKQ
jgi:hypothetical protein